MPRQKTHDCVFLNNYLFLQGNSCAEEIRKIILHLEFIIFVVFSAHNNPKIISVFLYQLRKEMSGSARCYNFFIIFIYNIIQNMKKEQFEFNETALSDIGPLWAYPRND